MSEKRSFDNPFKDYMITHCVIDSESGQLREDLKNRFLENINNLLNYFEKNMSKSFDWNDYTVYTGTTGIALLYLHLSNVLTDDSLIRNQLLDKSLSFVEPIIKNLKGRKHSFICGDCGPLAVAAIGHYSKNNHNECNRLLNSLKSMIIYAIDINTELADEVLYGRSGFLYSLLLVRKLIPNSDQIIDNNDIRSIVDAILKSGKRTAERERHGLCPLMYYWHQKPYIGAAHGLIGIMYMLLEAKQYLNNEELTKLVKPTIDFIASLRLSSGNYPSTLGNPNDRLIHWCHGSPGAVHLFALSHVVFGEDKYLNAAKECCDLIWDRGLLTKGYGLCHGISGNGYAFLRFYQLTNEEKYLYRAVKFGEFCFDYGQHGCRTPDRPFSLFEGLAGTVYYLSDLLNPMLSKYPAFQLSN